MTFVRAIARGDQARVAGLVAAAPELVLTRAVVGATRQGAESYFLDEIAHDVYAGDTAPHIAAAAHDADPARELVNAGAVVTAANRRGAEPLHFALDGGNGGALRAQRYLRELRTRRGSAGQPRPSWPSRREGLLLARFQTVTRRLAVLSGTRREARE